MKFLLLTISILLSFSLFAEEYVVVTSALNKDALDAGGVKNKYLLVEGSDKWSTGEKVVSYQPDLSDANNKKALEAFLSKYAGMTIGTYNEHWNDQKAKGRTEKPNVQADFKAIARFIKRDANGIAFLPKSLARGVKIIDSFEVN